LNLFAANFTIRQFPIMGVLQRIALCYIICAFLFMVFSPMVRRLVIVIFIAVFIGFLYGIDVPDCGRGELTPACNAGAYLDGKIFHDFTQVDQGETLLGILMAVFSPFMGVEVSNLLLAYQQKRSEELLDEGISFQSYGPMLLMWMGMGVLCIGFALFFWVWIPFNEKLWSLSFGLLTTGVAILVFLMLFVVLDIYYHPLSSVSSFVTIPGKSRGHVGYGSDNNNNNNNNNGEQQPSENNDNDNDSGGFTPLMSQSRCLQTATSSFCTRFYRLVLSPLLQPIIWLGMNAITVFVLMMVVEIVLKDSAPKVDCSGCPGPFTDTQVTVWDWIYWRGFVSLIDDYPLASLLVACLHLILWIFVSGIMYWRRFFVKL